MKSRAHHMMAETNKVARAQEHLKKQGLSPRAAERTTDAYGPKIHANSDLLNAKANMLKEQRLGAKADRETKIGQEAAKLENGRTQDSLSKLGAGKPFGE